MTISEAIATDPLELGRRWFLSRTSQHSDQTRTRQLDTQQVRTRSAKDKESGRRIARTRTDVQIIVG